MDSTFDVAIVGGGIVGLATAYRLGERRPALRLLVLEKEAEPGLHQTGHNSGVLHSGIYYKPGSLKAVNCREGRRAMERFCEEHGIPFETCGKVIVATAEEEVPRLEAILERGRANGVRCERIGRERLRELEPHAAGIAALHVPETGIVDYGQVIRRLASIVAQRGGSILYGARVRGLRRRGGRTRVEAVVTGEAAAAFGESDGHTATFEARAVVNCAGLHGDRVTRLSGQRPEAKIVPFRGEYYELVEPRRSLCRNLIYPVPDPRFPFLGVHFTRRIGGGVECGPNAVLAFAREGYRKSDVNLRDLTESMTYPGFLRLAARHWRTGLGEMWRSFSKRAFTRALQRLLPELREDDLRPAPAGVRAQALRPDGSLADDFLIVEGGGIVHVNNAPSPAATASLNIGRLVAERVAAGLG